MKTDKNQVEIQARLLAQENKKAEPSIEKIFWFPDNKEIRLIETETTVPKLGSGSVEPFYFDPSPDDKLTVPSGIALIHPNDYGKLTLPDGWCEWTEAKELKLDID